MSDTISDLTIGNRNNSPCGMSLPNITFKWVDFETHTRVTSWVQLLPNMHPGNMAWEIEKGGKAIKITYTWPDFFSSNLGVPMTFVNGKGEAIFFQQHSKMIALETFKKNARQRHKNYGQSIMKIALPVVCEEQFTTAQDYPGVGE